METNNSVWQERWKVLTRDLVSASKRKGWVRSKGKPIHGDFAAISYCWPGASFIQRQISATNQSTNYLALAYKRRAGHWTDTHREGTDREAERGRRRLVRRLHYSHCRKPYTTPTTYKQRKEKKSSPARSSARRRREERRGQSVGAARRS